MSLFDINEELPSNYSSGVIINKLFAEDAPVRFPKKDGDTAVLVMPGIESGGDPLAYLPYRTQNAGQWVWTNWATQFRSYQMIGGRLNVIDPIHLEGGFLDPVKVLLDIANSTPEFYHLVNKGPDGKKLQGDNAPPSLSASGVKFAINCVELNPRKAEDAGLSKVFIVNETAVKPKVRRNKNGTTSDDGGWGLINTLNIRQRNIQGVDPGDFARYYYWGDITDPNQLIPCIIQKQAPPSGGMPIWKMEPTDKINPVAATEQMLESRTQLTSIFANPDQKEIIEALIEIYGDEYPTLIRRAFESHFPGVANLLQQSGIVSPSRVHMPPAPAAAPAAAAPAVASTAIEATPKRFVPKTAPVVASPVAAAPAAAPGALTAEQIRKDLGV